MRLMLAQWNVLTVAVSTARLVRLFSTSTTASLLTCSALITGASSGIGAATAILYSKCGANVVLVARRADRLAEVKTKCEAANGGKRKVLVIEGDMSKKEDIEGVVPKLNGLQVDM